MVALLMIWILPNKKRIVNTFYENIFHWMQICCNNSTMQTLIMMKCHFMACAVNRQIDNVGAD